MKGIQAAYGFLGAFLGGAALGYLFDRWLHTSPWGLIVGTVFGFAGGLYALYNALMPKE